MEKNGDGYKVTIYGISIGLFKEGKITCQYEQSVEIESALIGSPVSSISVGASIDRNNRKLIICISATAKVIIDSSSIGILQFPVKGVADNSIFRILDATFTSVQGETFDAVILPVVPILFSRVNAGNKTDAINNYYMLNGRHVENRTLEFIKKKSVRFCMPILIIKK